jgi:hypothetical protein
MQPSRQRAARAAAAQECSSTNATGSSATEFAKFPGRARGSPWDTPGPRKAPQGLGFAHTSTLRPGYGLFAAASICIAMNESETEEDDEGALLVADGNDAEEEREETAYAMVQGLNSFIAVGRPVLITMVSRSGCYMRVLAKQLFEAQWDQHSFHEALEPPFECEGTARRFRNKQLFPSIHVCHATTHHFYRKSLTTIRLFRLTQLITSWVVCNVNDPDIDVIAEEYLVYNEVCTIAKRFLLISSQARQLRLSA